MEIIENLIQTNFKKEDKKNQIVLCHTSRTLFDYMVSIKFRFGGKPIRLPHYIISRDGRILKLIDEELNGYFTNNDRINAKSIVVCLENLGWLEKEPLKQHHINWIGNIYKEKVFDRKWRDYFFWHPYTEIQIEKTAELCLELMEKYKIEKNFIGHNTKVKGVESYMGIITRSNFDEFATDLSPAFNFEKFNKLLNDE
jgi:N-acetyl-anhydromuramyl-L-alanine amidase AmpD